MPEHKHEFHAIWWNFGQYGPQDVHMHPCECGVELQGPGKDCDGDAKSHRRIRYNTRSGKWTEVKKP
jgi:hypothetical protein